MTVDVTVLEIDDPTWDTLPGTADPYCSRVFVRATGAASGARPVLLVASESDWRVGYVLLLLPGGRKGQVLARTPEYGGPVVELDPVPSADPVTAALAARDGFDAALRRLGAVSEVHLLSPWLPWRGDVARAWSSTLGRPVCTVLLSRLDLIWATMSKGRRSDIKRTERDFAISVGPFDAAAGSRFAPLYAAAMNRVEAKSRWRRDETDWLLLARSSADVTYVEAVGRGERAAALFLCNGKYATYLFAARSPGAGGAASGVLWHGLNRLRDRGCVGVTLGGGTTDTDDDPLLRFKRSFSSSVVQFAIGARVFDAAGHADAHATGLARPLPEGAVRA